MTVGQILLDPLRAEKIIVDFLPPPVECPNGTTYGNYSLKLPNGWRVLDGKACRTLGHITDTQTAFTRCYLKSLPKRKMRSAQQEAFFRATVPQYCQPSESKGEAFYVDIVSAYLSIYRRMSWRVEYLRGHYFSNDDDKMVYPFPEDWKAGRSYVITGALPGTRRYVIDGSVRSTNCANPNLNLPLATAVWDVLCAIARHAIDRFDARYFNLDGAVIPESKFYDYCAFLDSMGLNYRIKYKGKSKILNLGTWKIGDDKTKRYSENGIALRTDKVPVSIDDADWILERFMRL